MPRRLKVSPPTPVSMGCNPSSRPDSSSSPNSITSTSTSQGEQKHVAKRLVKKVTTTIDRKLTTATQSHLEQLLRADFGRKAEKRHSAQAMPPRQQEQLETPKQK